MKQKKVYPKYDKDGPFMDPVVRCCDCQAIIFREAITKFGGCPKCGNKRIRNILNMTEEEIQRLKEKKVDPDFIALFEGTEEDGVV